MPLSQDNKTPNRKLPDGFTPGPNQVIIGRGKKVINHEGNRNLAEQVQSKLKAYEQAGNKTEKSFLIMRIVMNIKKANSTFIGFVKQHPKTGQWLALNDAQARISVAQAFRDQLSDLYRSSKRSKQVMRAMEKETNNMAGSTSTSSLLYYDNNAKNPPIENPPIDVSSQQHQHMTVISAYQTRLEAGGSLWTPPRHDSSRNSSMQRMHMQPPMMNMFHPSRSSGLAPTALNHNQGAMHFPLANKQLMNDPYYHFTSPLHQESPTSQDFSNHSHGYYGYGQMPIRGDQPIRSYQEKVHFGNAELLSFPAISDPHHNQQQQQQQQVGGSSVEELFHDSFSYHHDDHHDGDDDEEKHITMLPSSAVAFYGDTTTADTTTQPRHDADIGESLRNVFDEAPFVH